MLFQLVSKDTGAPIYTYDDETKKSAFTNSSTEQYMKDNGITVVIQSSDKDKLQKKTAKLTDSNFHELFLAYSKVEYNPSKFHWIISKKK